MPSSHRTNHSFVEKQMATKQNECDLLQQAMRHAYRSDVDAPSVAEYTGWVNLMSPPVDKERYREAEIILLRIYEDLVRAVRAFHTGTTTKRVPSTEVKVSIFKQPKKLTTQVAAELDAFRAAIDAMIEKAENLSWTSRRVIDETLSEHAGDFDIGHEDCPTFRKLWAQGHEALQLFAVAAERSVIATKKGRDEAALRCMVRALANIWNEFTGRSPRRSYNGSRAANTGQSGEDGNFLHLAQAIARCADRALQKEGLRVSSGSLSKIVRNLL